jgi:transcriptional regulator with XRE-family HTH domain
LPTFGENLRELRRRKGLGQAELAEKGGLNRSSVSTLETGATHPRPATIRALARALEIDPNDLFEGPQAPIEGNPPGSAHAAAGGEAEKLEILEATTTSILEMVEGFDPANNSVDRVAVEFLGPRLLEIIRVLAEKTGDRNTPLAYHLRVVLETAGEETEMVLGVDDPPAKTTHGESEQSQIKEAHEAPRGP